MSKQRITVGDPINIREMPSISQLRRASEADRHLDDDRLCLDETPPVRVGARVRSPHPDDHGATGTVMHVTATGGIEVRWDAGGGSWTTVNELVIVDDREMAKPVEAETLDLTDPVAESEDCIAEGHDIGECCDIDCPCRDRGGES